MVRRLYSTLHFVICIYQDIAPICSVERAHEMGNRGHNAATVSFKRFFHRLRLSLNGWDTFLKIG